MQRDLGSYDYVQRVYNENMRLTAYKLPQTAADGDVIFIDDGLIKLTMQIADGRVLKITIVATNPRSSVYMQVFEGFEFGFSQHMDSKLRGNDQHAWPIARDREGHVG